MTERRKAKRVAGRPSQVMSQQLSQEVLRAALDIFLESGFALASMKAIAERAGATRQTLYARFADKTTLFEEVVEARTSELLSRMAVTLEASEPPEVVLARFGTQIVAAFIDSDLQRLHHLVIAEVRSFPDLGKVFFKLGPDRGRRMLARYLEEQVARGRLQIENAELAAEQFVGSLVGAVVLRSTLRQGQLLDSAEKRQLWIETAVRAFLSTYRPG